MNRKDLLNSQNIQIRRLKLDDAATYRALMLQAYDSEPEAFTATVAEREPLPLSWWESRMSDQPNPDELVFGAFSDTKLVGVAGLQQALRPRTQHKAKLFGMYVLPAFRGHGTAHKLIDAVLTEARAKPATEVVQLTVTETNTAAIKLYSSCGFEPFGTEPFANQIDGRFVSIIHMWCPVGAVTTKISSELKEKGK